MTPSKPRARDLGLPFPGTPGPMPQHAGAVLTKTEINGEHIDPLYMAAVQSVEEAVINAIVAGENTATVKPPGQIVPGIDTAKLAALF